MFLCVWLYFKKFSEKYFLVFGKCYKEKDKTKKKNTAPRLTLAIDWLRRRLTAIDGVRRREGEIAIDGTISRSVDRNLAKHRADRNQREGGFAIDGAGACERRRLELGRANGADWVSVSLLRSRSLSLSLRNSFEVKIGTEIHFRSQSLFFWVNENQFPENSIFRTNQYE